VTHGWPGIYHGMLYGALTVLFMAGLWRWRQWYVTTADVAHAGRTLWLAWGAAALFVALWLLCGRNSMNITVLQWAVPPIALAGAGALARGWGRPA